MYWGWAWREGTLWWWNIIWMRFCYSPGVTLQSISISIFVFQNLIPKSIQSKVYSEIEKTNIVPHTVTFSVDTPHNCLYIYCKPAPTYSMNSTLTHTTNLILQQPVGHPRTTCRWWIITWIILKWLGMRDRPCWFQILLGSGFMCASAGE